MKALIIAGNGTTDQEYFYPLYRLDEAGFEIDTATPSGEAVRGVAGIEIKATRALPHPAIPEPQYDLLVLAGGVKAIEKLRQERNLIRFVGEHHGAGGVIASICHGTQLLISAGLCRGRRVSGYYSIRDDIENAGGRYVDEPAVVCERIVSTAHYKHLGPWMAAALGAVKVGHRCTPSDLNDGFGRVA